MAMHIPDLGRKLKLLGDHTDLDSAAKLAQHFDLSVSRINEFRTGGSKGQPDTVPSKHISKLVMAFAKAFRHPPPDDQLEDLLYGPAQALEDAIRDDAIILLEDILAAEARQHTGRLHRQDSIGLVEHDDDDDEGHHVVRLNERFMLEFDVQKAGYMLVITNAQQDWGLIKLADGGFSKRITGGSIIVPGLARGRYTSLYERNTRGLHRFMLFISPIPFPAVFAHVYAGRQKFDWNMLCRIARYYEQLQFDLREIHMMSVNMV